MSYHRYDLPKEPPMPYGGAVTAFGVLLVLVVGALVSLIAWCLL